MLIQKLRRIGLGSFLLAAVGGCGTTDPRSRVHVSPERDPTWLEHAEMPLEYLQQALDNLDRDMENVVY